MDQLKPCPFCGKSVAEISDMKDCERCANFDQEDICQSFETPDSCGVFIVCNFNRGGCGSSTGWHQTADRAVAAWNKRA